jgi:KamA family protein
MSSGTFRAYGARDLEWIGKRHGLAAADVDAMREMADVLPFRVNAHVLEELIDWDAVPDDPIFQMTFPQRGMLSGDHWRKLSSVRGRSASERTHAVNQIRLELNPHPAAQITRNVPRDASGNVLSGLQHKYVQTVLLFPSAGQTCHAYCSYCFRWPQFVGESSWRFATPSAAEGAQYVAEHPQVTDVLVTGGDPMMMSAERLGDFLAPLLRIPTLRTVRIGTKFVAYWPQRVLTDRDADDMLAVLAGVVDAGKNLAVMHHLSHPVEVSTEPAIRALGRLREVGAMMYSQAPMMRHVNDTWEPWARLWTEQLGLGVQPYYMFVARDTGAQEYYKVPLTQALTVFEKAYSQSPGLARTVRGPVMSTTEGKIKVEAATAMPDGRVAFDLVYLQARDPDAVNRRFRKVGLAGAAWIDDLRSEA